MSELATLHIRLSRLLAAPSETPGASRYLAFDVGHAHEAVRNEIDETQLSRRLVFRNDRGEEMALDVASGRVLRSARPQAPSATEQNCSRPTSPSSEQPDLSGLKQEIEQFSTQAKSISVEAHILKRTSMVLDMGVPADALFSESPSSVNGNVVDALNAFVELAGGLELSVYAHDEHDVIYDHGDAQLRKAFESTIVPLLRTGGVLPDQSTLAECFVISESRPKGRSILCAQKECVHVAVFFEQRNVEEVLHRWSKIFSVA